MDSSINRRDFLGATGTGLIFALAAIANTGPFDLVGEAAAQAPLAPNVWLHIDVEGGITIASPAAELGQGSFTALPVIVAEELDADWAKVRIVQPPVWDPKKYGNPGYGQRLSTTSSASIDGYFKTLRIAGAQARRVLLDAVAQKWGVSVAELVTEPSVVVHRRSNRRISYGEIATFAKVPAKLPAIGDADLKSSADFRLIGKDVPRVELGLKVTGAAKYAMDVQVPGMLYAAVVQAPYFGAEPSSVDDKQASRIPGVIGIHKIPGGVGVIGETVEATHAAKRVLAATWSDAKGASYDSERALDEFQAIARDSTREGVPFVRTGDAKAAMQTAARVFRGEYRTRHVYHAQMEPLNATASVTADGKAEIWAGTQAPGSVAPEIAAAIGLKPENITFHQQWVGGGFGRRSQMEVLIDAARLSKIVGRPVKLIWSREDDIAFGKFRPATAHLIEAGFDGQDKLIAWRHRVVAESVSAYLATLRGTKPSPRDQIVMKGTPIPQYSIPNKLAEHVIESRGTRLAAWRGVGNAHNAFAAESFLCLWPASVIWRSPCSLCGHAVGSERITMQGKIAVEEHFAIEETIEDSRVVFPGDTWAEARDRLTDLHGRRIRLMDKHGIEMMLLSLNLPAVQGIPDSKKAYEIARKANDYLAEQVARRPDRFQALAALPMQDPELAVSELERCVKEMGFKGALVNGFSQVGNADTIVYYDMKQFWPFWAVVEKLDVPFYLHPRNPLPQHAKIYEDHGWLMGPSWAFGQETAVHALRLMGSGLFDAYPKLNVVLGHMGEGLPFSMWRVDSCTAWIPGRKRYPAKRRIQEYFRDNFYVTTSGNFRTQALINTILEISPDRIMFSIDWPFENIDHAATWFDAATMSERDRHKIGRDNARKLFKLG